MDVTVRGAQTFGHIVCVADRWRFRGSRFWGWRRRELAKPSPVEDRVPVAPGRPLLIVAWRVRIQKKKTKRLAFCVFVCFLYLIARSLQEFAGVLQNLEDERTRMVGGARALIVLSPSHHHRQVLWKLTASFCFFFRSIMQTMFWSHHWNGSGKNRSELPRWESFSFKIIWLNVWIKCVLKLDICTYKNSQTAVRYQTKSRILSWIGSSTWSVISNAVCY